MKSTFKSVSVKAYYKLCIATLLVCFYFTGQGQSCVDIDIPALPFSTATTTCNAGNDINAGNSCGSWFMTGEDLTFAFTTDQEECLNLELSGFTDGALGVIVTSDCPEDGDADCVASASSMWGVSDLSLVVSTAPSTTYYITVSTDNWLATCTDFSMELSSVCPDPTPEDCLGAINICEDYFFEPTAPLGNGNYPDDLGNTACGFFGANNSGWYTFTIQEDGVLNFTLTPTGDDDYDWALFDLTNATCSEISTNPDLLVSCNTYGLIGVNGPTGISSAEGGTGSANGPGDLNGPPFNADYNVVAGETYVLMVSNWSGTTNGYELDLSESTATFIDDVLPEVNVVNASCDGLYVQFSEYMDCATVLPEHFTVQDETGLQYPVSAVESSCEDGLDYTLSVVLSFDLAFPSEGGEFTLNFQADELADLCGNFLEPSTFPFTVADGPEISITSIPAACGNSNGAITVDVVSGGVEPFTFRIDNEAFQTSNVFSGLLPGDYTITTMDATGCQYQSLATVENEEIEFTAGVDINICENQYQATATVPDGYSGQWTVAGDVEIADPTDPNTTFTANEAGTFEFIWTITNGVNCTESKSIEIGFTDIQPVAINITSPICHNGCDGSAEVLISGVPATSDVTYTWSDGDASPDQPTQVENLCSGLVSLNIVTDVGCEYELVLPVSNPPELHIDELTSTAESCPEYCDGEIMIQSDEAVDYSIDGGETFKAGGHFTDLCAGFYTVVVRNESQCETSATLTIFAPEGPSASFYAIEKRKSVLDPNFEFENTSENFTSSYWEFEHPNGKESSRDENPSFSFSDPGPGEYDVMLVASNETGCADTTHSSISLYEDEMIYIPNSFTPNGDGINDVFKVSGVGIGSVELQIYDRWGMEIYKESGTDVSWNGDINSNGYYPETGVYIYKLKVHSAEDPRVVWEESGNVLLLR